MPFRASPGTNPRCPRHPHRPHVSLPPGHLRPLIHRHPHLPCGMGRRALTPKSKCFGGPLAGAVFSALADTTCVHRRQVRFKEFLGWLASMGIPQDECKGCSAEIFFYSRKNIEQLMSSIDQTYPGSHLQRKLARVAEQEVERVKTNTAKRYSKIGPGRITYASSTAARSVRGCWFITPLQ